MKIITQYFPGLEDVQVSRFQQLEPLYASWNAQINVISRKDIGNLCERHILHSLAIAKVVQFKPRATVLDIGTGGGFPGIPLAILFPAVHFHLIDGTAKKIKVVKEVAASLGLENVTAQQIRAEELKGVRFDFVVSRAVAELPLLKQWSHRLLKPRHQHALPNGLLALKGGDIKKEIKALSKGEYVEIYPISSFFREPWFEEKYVVYVQG